MAAHWANREKMRANLSSSGKWGHIWWFLAMVFAVLGIIADAVNGSLGLEAASWFLLAIIALLASVTMFIGWAVSWYLETTAAKKGE